MNTKTMAAIVATMAVVVMVAAATLGAQSLVMTDAQIAQAVTVGLKGKGKPQGLVLRDSGAGFMAAMSSMNTTGGATSSSGFWLEAFTPLSWIQQQASNAAKEYRTMTPENVGPAMREPVFRVLVHPDTPNTVSAAGMRGTSSVQHVVLRAEDKKIVIQPLSKEEFTEDAQNAMGAKVAFTGLAAQFPLDGLRELRGPKGDKEFFITVVGASGEEKNFKVKNKHFEDLK